MLELLRSTATYLLPTCLALVFVSASSQMGNWTDLWWSSWFGDQDGQGIKQAKFILRKLWHVILFASVGCCWAAHRYTGKKAIGWSVSMLILLGIASEVYQLGAPGRRPRLSDALLNGVAAVGGLLIYRQMRRSAGKSRASEADG